MVVVSGLCYLFCFVVCVCLFPPPSFSPLPKPRVGFLSFTVNLNFLFRKGI